MSRPHVGWRSNMRGCHRRVLVWGYTRCSERYRDGYRQNTILNKIIDGRNGRDYCTARVNDYVGM
jgi:hypothetical protein